MRTVVSPRRIGWFVSALEIRMSSVADGIPDGAQLLPSVQSGEVAPVHVLVPDGWTALVARKATLTISRARRSLRESFVCSNKGAAVSIAASS